MSDGVNNRYVCLCFVGNPEVDSIPVQPTRNCGRRHVDDLTSTTGIIVLVAILGYTPVDGRIHSVRAAPW